MEHVNNGKSKPGWALLLGLAAAGLLIGRYIRSRRPTGTRTFRPATVWSDFAVDEALEDTFPASDAPSWSPVSGTRPTP